jgi:hypothetical protein
MHIKVTYPYLLQAYDLLSTPHQMQQMKTWQWYFLIPCAWPGIKQSSVHAKLIFYVSIFSLGIRNTVE